MLPPAFVTALAVHAGALVLYQALQPVPLPRLTLHFDGEGGGRVLSSPAGLSCTGRCVATFEPGTRVRLIAVVDERSTFEGWSDACTPRPDWVLECELVMEEDVQVQVGFGLMPEAVEVAWARLPETPEDEPSPIRLPDPEIEAERLSEPIEEPEVASAPEEEPPEEKAPEEEAAPEPPPQQAALDVEIMNLRSVEVPDENEVEEAPEDATHLSDKNRKVAEETSATQTNLEREQQGETPPSEESDVQSEEIGAEEDVIAELEDAEPPTLEERRDQDRATSTHRNEVAGVIAGERGEGGERPSDRPGLLSMRGVEGRGSLLPDEGSPDGDAGKRPGSPGIKTQLGFEDYERIFGAETVEEEIALGRTKRRSSRRGRFERKQAAVQSALENFTPEIRPGNQTALNTRAAPFAVYIARMHRRIHMLWAEGFLDDLNDKSSTHPLNQWTLNTKIEIVLEPDGSVHKTTIVEHSGILEFDVAAIDVILTAAPFEAPPDVIRSPDGRVYIHWGFHRDWRACGTFNAQPFILAEARSADRMDDGDLVRGIPRRRQQRRAQSASKPSGSEGSSSAQAAPPSAEEPGAMHTANLWLAGFSRRNVSRMLTVTGAPFYSGDTVVASSVGEVSRVYRDILDETRGQVRDWKLMTPAGYRQRFGSVPGPIRDGKGQLLMVVRAGREQFTLVLATDQNGSYRVVGLQR